MAKASLDAQATSPGAVATTRHAHHCLRRCALFREALDRVPRRCGGTPRPAPCPFRVGRPVVINTGGRTEELHELAKYTTEGIVVKKPLAYSHDGGERVTQQAIVPQQMPTEVVQHTAALADTAHNRGRSGTGRAARNARHWIISVSRWQLLMGNR